MEKKKEQERKVYVITKGCYSDYHICAITLDKNNAHKLKRMLDDTMYEACIEEFIVDETKENGRVYEIMFYEDKTSKVSIDEYDGWGKVNEIPHIEDWHSDCELKVRLRAKDEQHALKVAQDEYALWKAKKGGVL